VQVRVWVPPPQGTEQEDHPLHPPFTGVTQAWVLQFCKELPEQLAPPPEGEGQEQLLVWVPPPQEAEQLDHPHQPPFTGLEQL
jgi:hypothetical protein